MTPEQWSRLEDLFERGMDRSAADRESLLNECADDPAVQSELRRLWEHESPSFLDTPLEFTRLLTRQSLLAENDVISNRFTVLERIGGGGMGEVWRARDERLRRIVAVKVLASRLAGDATYRKRLEQEARSVSSLSHPAICSLHDLGTDGDLLYLVMEYVSGEALDKRLRGGPIPEPEAIDIALEICAGLEHAHANGIIHRDLKPANVVLSPHGVKLLDFGIAYRKGTADPAAGTSIAQTLTGLTAIGEIVGTPAYMSPEQAGGRTVDARSDIYSFGVLLEEMLRPAANRSTEPGQISPALGCIIERCREADPNDRFPSVAELRKALHDTTRTKPSQLRRFAAPAAVALFVIAGALWYAKRADSQTAQPRLTTLTAYPGTEYSPTLSPDGNSIAFLWNGQEDNYDIYVRSIDSDSPTRLTTDPAPERTPRWSPDGRWIAFERSSKIILISPFGGPERSLTTVDHDTQGPCDQRLAWSADAKRIFFSKVPQPGQSAAIHDIDIDTGVVRKLSNPSSGGDWCPVPSPDGKLLLIQRIDTGRSKSVLAELSDQGIAAERDVPWIDGWSHTFLPDSKEVIFTRNTRPVAFLFRAGIDASQEAKQLPFGEEGMYPVFSRKGDRLIYMRRQMDINMWRAPLASRAKDAESSAAKLSPSTRPDAVASYSPDGTRVAFVSERSGKPELWLADPEGGHLKRLAPCDPFSRISAGVPGWSPDGQRLVYSYQNDLYTLLVNGTENPEILVPGPAADYSPSYSRDGKWIYFTSERTGRPEIWRIPATGGAPVQITTSGAHLGIESFSGSELFLLRHEDNRDFLFVMPAAGGAETRIAEVYLRPTLAVAKAGLYFVPAGVMDDSANVSVYDLATRSVRQVAQLPARLRSLASGLSISPDGKSVLYSRFELQGDLMLVDNFR
jgi:serine/threonine protein kinase